MFIILMIIVLYHKCRINTRGIYCHLDRWGSKTDNDESFFDCLKVQVLFQKKNSYVCFLFKSKQFTKYERQTLIDDQLINETNYSVISEIGPETEQNVRDRLAEAMKCDYR